MDHVQVDFRLPNDHELRSRLIGQLELLHVLGFEESATGIIGYWEHGSISSDQLESIAGRIGLDELFYEVTDLEDRNWNQVWEDGFDPIRVDDLCMIRASHHSPDRSMKWDVVIDPQMSFGTGHHSTTQLMVRELLKLELEGKRLADVGCGTGVLAILASKLGAAEVWANDIEEWAYHNTRTNLTLNEGVDVVVKKGTFESLNPPPFNVILANINKNVLQAELPAYARSLEPKGILLLSGFFETDTENLIKQAEELGLIFADQQGQEGWAVLKMVMP